MVPISILIPAKNEIKNIEECLRPIRNWAGEIVVVDSGSTDGTIEMAKKYGAKVLQFKYTGGWPKKRQWALDTYKFTYDWILLLDVDEIMLEPVKKEIEHAITQPSYNGYLLRFEVYFLGKQLRHGDTALYKMSLFRKGMGKYEQRISDQDTSMADMEIHEHVVVNGKTDTLNNPVKHCNLNSLGRYLEKHNEYSNWSARVYTSEGQSGVQPRLFGTQRERRRFIKKYFLKLPGSPLLLFFYKYIVKLGFLDGVPGFLYCSFHGIQLFIIKAKMYEITSRKTRNKSNG